MFGTGAEASVLLDFGGELRRLGVYDERGLRCVRKVTKAAFVTKKGDVHVNTTNVSKWAGIVLLLGCSSKPNDNSVGTVAPAPPTPSAATPAEQPRTPVVLAHLKFAPHDIAIDADSVYVTSVDFESQDNSPTDIIKLPKTGGAQTALASRQMGADGLTVAGGTVYWIVAGDSDQNIPDGVMALSVKGGQPKRVGTTFMFGDATMAVDAKYAYYGGLRDGASKLKRLPLAGGAEEEIASHGEGGKDGGIITMAVDQKHVYWVAGGSIVSVPLQGGSPTVLVDHQGWGDVWGMASDGSHLYWTDRGGYKSDEAKTGKVHRVPVDGGPMETIASGLRGRPWGIAVDDSNAYVVINADQNGGIIKVAKSGGTPTVFVAGQSSPVHLAVDAGFVYWANSGGDYAVAKAPK